MSKRNLYLKIKTPEEALEIYQSAMAEKIKADFEEIPVTEALGRITAAAIYAKYSSPLFDAAAMDGIAVIAKHTEGASERNPLLLEYGKDYRVVDTGDPVKAPYDAVIMAEDTVETPEGMKIIGPAHPWQHVRPVGEDIVAGEMILSGNHLIRPVDIGVLLSAGILKIQVVRKPRVAIFPTGTELLEPEASENPETWKEGAIIESNSRMFESMVTQAGGCAVRFPPLADDCDTIRNAVKKAAEAYDMVLINAGSSAGREDYTAAVLKELGRVFVHGVSMKPGKPVILAEVGGKPVIGLPGYPVAAYLSFESFAAPILELLTKSRRKKPGTVSAVMSRRLVSGLKYKEYVRVKVGKVENRFVAAPLSRGAGAAMSLVRGDGFCVIPQNREGIEAGETVEVILYREPEEIESTVVVIGSHDLILDVMADLLPVRHPGMFLSATHVGSMGGLMALKRGEAHLAPIHLLDEKTGEYNAAYLEKLFDEPVLLVKGVGRTQGILVKRGNPLGIRKLADLKGIRFVNRQRGAGTRVLLDYLLKEQGICSTEIRGYDREVMTHMAVAAAVKSGSADAGMGIFSAAKAMDLDFIPIAQEEYDFALPEKNLELPHVKAFLEILQSEAFRERLEQLGGYTMCQAGEIRNRREDA